MNPDVSQLIVLERGENLQGLIASVDSPGQFRCLPARNREELFDRLQNVSPDAVIAQASFPELSGLETLELVKSLFPLVPVVIAFETDDPPACIEALKRGAVDFLVEDRPATCLPAIERALSDRRGRRLQQLATELLNNQQRALSLVASGMPVTDVLDLLLFILHKHLPNVSLLFHRVDRESRRLVRLADSALSDGLRSRFESLHLDGQIGTLTHAFQSERISFGHEKDRLDWSGLPGGYPAPFPAICSVPIQAASEKIIGLLTLLFPTAGEPEPTAMAIIDNLLQIASIALENEIREDRLREAIAEAERANREKSRFIVNLSHEIRTPMNGIIGMGDLLARTPLTNDQREILDVIRSSGDVLLNLIDDIIDLSRIESGRLQLEKEPFRVRETVVNVIRLLTARAAANETGLFMEVAPEIPDVLIGDELRLQQILTNLINNSIKFTDHGEIRTRVSVIRTHEEEEETVRLNFSVSDTGAGIPADKLKSIFAPFVQIEPRGENRYRGAGLGLAISSSLAQLMEGSLRVESEVGRGSTFQFDLPLRLARAGQAPVAANVTSEDGPAEFYPLSILVVEDDVSNRLVIERLLQKIGYAPDMATHGQEALDQVARRPYDVVLMDVQMAEMDGLEATRRILKQFPERARVIIALTANAMKEDMARCLEAGMSDYLSKPVSFEQIRQMLWKWGRKMSRLP